MLIGPVIEMSANPRWVMSSFLEAALYLGVLRSSMSLWHVQQLCKKLSS